MLELLVRNPNFLSYRSCSNWSVDTTPWKTLFPTAQYNATTMCNTSFPYMESIQDIEAFVYDQAADVYRLVTVNNIAYFPGWEFWSYIISPETGEIVSSDRLPGAALATFLTDQAFNGGLGKIWAGHTGFLPFPAVYGITEVLLPNMYATSDMLANPILTNTQIPILAGTNFGFALAPEAKLITVLTLMGGPRISVWDYSTSGAWPSSTPATEVYYHPAPESFAWGTGYEDEQRMWALFANTISGQTADRQSILKYNYASNRIELLTEMQNIGGNDRMARICFDTRRKKLAAVRIKADATNGAAQNALEIYAPRPAMTMVTVPVAITRLSNETEVHFISNLLGTKGEAGGLKKVSISCSPDAGLVSKPSQLSEVNGRVEIVLKPTVAAAVETLTVSYDETKVTS
jgi:hypothetical protein